MTGSPHRPPTPELERACASTRRMWSLALLTPIVYLLLGMLFESAGWIGGRDAGGSRLDSPAAQGGLSGVLLLLFSLTVWRRLVLRRTLARPLGDVAAAAIWRREALRMLILADTQGLVGLAAFWMSGREEALLAGGVAAYLTYAMGYPLRSDLPVEKPE